MRNVFILFLVLMYNPAALGQAASTEIYLVNMSFKGGKYVFTVPVNITNHDGYDNQPEFSPDGKKILYVSMPDSTQSEVYEYSIADSAKRQLTQSPESEYSPKYSPDGKSVSLVRVDSDKAQRLYRFPGGFDEEGEMIPGLDSVGYYAWINDSSMAFASLNNGMELLIYDLNYGQYVVYEKGIGRCLMSPPGMPGFIFTRKSGGKVSLFHYRTESEKAILFCEGLADVEDYVFTPDGKLLAGLNGKLFIYDPIATKQWTEAADFSESCGSFYRMAVSPGGKHLALVSYKGKRP